MRITTIKELRPVINDIQHNLGLTGRQDYIEFYRGQGLDSYKLVNGLARFNHTRGNIFNKERKLFDKYFQQVRDGHFDFIQDPYNQKGYNFTNEWFYLFQGQHLGLKTRLIDWTASWKRALLFAVDNENQFGQDGQFWVFICPRKQVINSGDLEKIYNGHPLDISHSYMINSPFYQDLEKKDYISERRRARQHGRFFIQPSKNCLIPLEEQSNYRQFICKYVIDGEAKKSIKQELNEAGCTIEWSYYRRDNSIDEKIKFLNNLIMKNVE